MTACRVCSTEFIPFQPLQSVCGVACARKVPVIQRKSLKAQAKLARQVDAQKREALKTRSQWMVEAQAAFNDFIRARDADQPCICCGKWPKSEMHTGGDWDAGHYRSRGAAPELRFDERNVHKQLKRCNRQAFDAASYRANLIQRIGLNAVVELEGPHPPQKFTIAELKAIRDTYRAKLKAVQAAPSLAERVRIAGEEFYA